MGFEINTNNIFNYKNNSFEELIYVYDDKSLMRFLKKHCLAENKKVFEEHINNNYFNPFKLIITENEYNVNITDYFKSGYKFYLDKVQSNIKNGEISSSNQPYINLILSKLNNLVIESLKEQQVKFSVKEVKTTTNKPTSKIVESYFILNENYTFNLENLTNGLKNRNKFIHKNTKKLSVKNIFKQNNSGTIDWIGGKDRLGLFVFLLKKKGIIKNECHFKVAVKLFKLGGKTITSLSAPKNDDAIRITKEIEKLIDNNFTLNSPL